MDDCIKAHRDADTLPVDLSMIVQCIVNKLAEKHLPLPRSISLSPQPTAIFAAAGNIFVQYFDLEVLEDQQRVEGPELAVCVLPAPNSAYSLEPSPSRP